MTTERNIKADVEQELEWDRDLDSANIAVSERGGIVTEIVIDA